MAFSEKLLDFSGVRDLLRARCVCDLGRRRVDELAPMTDPARLADAIGLTREMMAILAGRDEPPIHELRDVSASLKKAAPDRALLEPMELLDIKNFCETAGRMRQFFETRQTESPGLKGLALPLYEVPALVRSIDEKIGLDGNVRDSASETLRQLRSEILSSEQKIQRDLQRLVRHYAASGDLQDDFFTLRNDRYVLPVKTSNRGKVRGIIHDSSNTGETVFIEPMEILEESHKLADLKLREREEIYRILLRVAGHIRDELGALVADAEILAEFDLLFAKARLGGLMKGAFPSLTGSDRPLSLVDAHHPLLYAAAPDQSRPLNLQLDTTDRVLVITGPNAGGKTTSLKTVGLTVLMVQCAIPVPVNSRSHMPVFQNVLATIGDEQNVLEGQSTFSAHMRRIVGVLNQANDASLVLLDELGTATDPNEGGALAVAIVEALAERGSLTVISTHLSVLKNWAHSHPKARNAAFRLSDDDHRPTFRLIMDVPGISEALIVAEQVGIPKEIIERARALRPEGEQDVTALILSLQQKEQSLAEELSALQAATVELDFQKSEVARFEAKLREDKRRYRAEMLSEKEKAIGALRAKLEALIARQPSKQELNAARAEMAGEVEAARRETQAAAAGDHPVLVPGTLKKGDAVLVRSLNDEGVIQEIFDKRGEARVMVRRMAVVVKLSDLDRVSAVSPALPPQKTQTGHVHFQRPTDLSLTVDLHGSRAIEAIEKVEKQMDQALSAGMGYIRVVHGQGSGALRRALHDHLRGHPLVKTYRHGTPAEGGGAVTIIEFE
ncbi:MAG: endonuclease MutS2 [Candidatus Sumerlaeaceae bacterium]|nr:endonuclease MutS2 [Candidatus Sumerlaeaceae bacterium]